jgi:hypothetical protein
VSLLDIEDPPLADCLSKIRPPAGWKSKNLETDFLRFFWLCDFRESRSVRTLEEGWRRNRLFYMSNNLQKRGI